MKRSVNLIAIVLLATLGIGLSLGNSVLQGIALAGLGLVIGGLMIVAVARMKPAIWAITLAVVALAVVGHLLNQKLEEIGLISVVLWIGGLVLFQFLINAKH